MDLKEQSKLARDRYKAHNKTGVNLGYIELQDSLHKAYGFTYATLNNFIKENNKTFGSTFILINKFIDDWK